MDARSLACLGPIVAALGFPFLPGCGADETARSAPAAGGSGAGGAPNGAGGSAPDTGGAASGTGGTAGSGGMAASGGTNSGGAPTVDGGGTDGGSSEAGDADAGPGTVADLVDRGRSADFQTPRSAYGGLVAASDGARVYVVESRRDVEPGPEGPWRSRFRVAAYDAGVEVWAFDADPDDLVGDVVVHPSGDVTVSVERFAPESNAYDLVRLSRAGDVIGRTTLPSPVTMPASDFAPIEPHPLFRMKSQSADATTAGWLRLLPDGEGLVIALLSFLAVPPTDPLANRTAMGVETLDWRSNTYVERWARVVEGAHLAQPVAWAYDELRWRQQVVRPFLARDDSSGDILVGRAWNSLRCRANVQVFAEFPPQECIVGAVGTAQVEWVPLAVTRFDHTGARLGTRILRPDADAMEQAPFAIAARGGEIAVVGAVVRMIDDAGTKKTYPDANGFVDYDGYVAVYDADGVLLRHHDYDQGRGDMLAGMRWTDAGIVAVGASGWDRWQGGMSISRGANPLFVWFSEDGTDTRQRVVPLGNPSRHWNLHDVLVLDGAVAGYGFADAPMTHSADGGGTAARTFGGLQVRLGP